MPASVRYCFTSSSGSSGFEVSVVVCAGSAEEEVVCAEPEVVAPVCCGFSVFESVIFGIFETQPTICIPIITMRRTIATVFIISSFFIIIAPKTHTAAVTTHSAVSNIANPRLTLVPTSSPTRDPIPTLRKSD